MTYPAAHTCKSASKRRSDHRTHELDTTTGKALCARRNKAAANGTYKPLGPGHVDCVRCAGYVAKP